MPADGLISGNPQAQTPIEGGNVDALGTLNIGISVGIIDFKGGADLVLKAAIMRAFPFFVDEFVGSYFPRLIGQNKQGSDEGRVDTFRVLQVRSLQVRSSQVRSSQARSSQVRSLQVRSSQARASQVRSSQVRSLQVRSLQVRSSQVRVLQVRASQVRVLQVRVFLNCCFDA